MASSERAENGDQSAKLQQLDSGRTARHAAISIAAIGGVIVSAACQSAENPKVLTPAVEARPEFAATFEMPSLTSVVPSNTPEVKTPNPEQTPIADREVNQGNFLTFLDADPARFQFRDAPKHSGAVREIDGLLPVDRNIFDTKINTTYTNKADFLAAMGQIPAGNINKAKAVLMTMNEGIMSDSEIEAVVDYYKSKADFSTKKPTYVHISADYVELEAWEVYRHECMTLDGQHRNLYDPDLIKRITYRYYLSIPTVPPSLPPDVKAQPVVPVTESKPLVEKRTLPTPVGQACE